MALIGMRQLVDHAAGNVCWLPVKQIREGIKHRVRKVKSLAVMQVAYDAVALVPEVH